MYLPCELSVKKYLPALRAAVVRTLVEKEGFTQSEAASALGITQAAASKYLSSKQRAVGGKMRAQVNVLAKEMAKSIASHKPLKLSLDFCTVCAGKGLMACSLGKKRGRK